MTHRNALLRKAAIATLTATLLSSTSGPALAGANGPLFAKITKTTCQLSVSYCAAVYSESGGTDSTVEYYGGYYQGYVQAADGSMDVVPGPVGPVEGFASNLNGTVYTIGIGGLNSLPPAPSQAAVISFMQGTVSFIEAQGPAICSSYVEPVTYTPVSNLCQNTTTVGAVRVVGTPPAQILSAGWGPVTQ